MPASPVRDRVLALLKRHGWNAPASGAHERPL